MTSASGPSPPHRGQDRLGAARRRATRERSRPRGLPPSSMTSPQCARPRQGRHRRVFRRDRARPPQPRLRHGRMPARGEARPPRRSGRSRLRMPGRRRCASTKSSPRRSLSRSSDTEERRRYLNARSTLVDAARRKARCPSSTRTIRSRPPRSAMATMTGSPRASPR